MKVTKLKDYKANFTPLSFALYINKYHYTSTFQVYELDSAFYTTLRGFF